MYHNLLKEPQREGEISKVAPDFATAGSRNSVVRLVIIWYYHCTSCQFSQLGVTK